MSVYRKLFWRQISWTKACIFSPFGKSLFLIMSKVCCTKHISSSDGTCRTPLNLHLIYLPDQFLPWVCTAQFLLPSLRKGWWRTSTSSSAPRSKRTSFWALLQSRILKRSIRCHDLGFITPIFNNKGTLRYFWAEWDFFNFFLYVRSLATSVVSSVGMLRIKRTKPWQRKSLPSWWM